MGPTDRNGVKDTPSSFSLHFLSCVLKIEFRSLEKMSMTAAILCPAACVSDEKCQIHRGASFFRLCIGKERTNMAAH